jgi:hypothetical protein
MNRRCFVIGPMSYPHKETLEWLAFDVVKPLLPADFDVKTPDSSEIGNIMTHVIKSCDRAHLVIANTTGNNPNVLYEIAVLDAMGRACIPVKIVSRFLRTRAARKGEQDDPIAFDRAAYRIFPISRSPHDRKKTDDTIRAAIESALDIRARGDKYQNPLTDFFGVPLSSFSSAYGLARTYYRNLVVPAVPAIDRNDVTDSAFDPKEYPESCLELVIPRRLSNASRESVDKLVKGEHIKPVRLEAKGRKIFIYEWIEQKKPVFRWMDIPTTLSTLHETVLGRRGRDANPDDTNPEYLEIEQDEIDGFARSLKGLIDTHGGITRSVAQVIPWSKTTLPPENTP